MMVGALLKRKRGLIISLSATALLIMVFALIHMQSYGVDWQGSKAIGQIVNYDQFHYDENQKIYFESGLSKNDYLFLKNWGFVDDKVYSIERLDYILNNAKKTAVETTLLPTLESAVSFPAANYLLILAVLALLALLIYRQKYSEFFIYVILPFLLCVGILAWQGRFPTRVSTAIAYALPWAILVQCGELRNRMFSAVIAVVAFVAVAVPVYGQYQDLTGIVWFRLAQNQELRQMGKAISTPPIVLVTLGASFPYEGILPFESPDFLSGANFVWLCGMNQTPVQKKQLADNDIKDVFVKLITDDTTYIVLHPLQTAILKRYIYEHYQKNINITPVFNTRSFVTYRLTPAAG